MPSVMAHETREIPEVVERIFAAARHQNGTVSRLQKICPPIVLLCARGSSAYAGLYVRQLIENYLDLPVYELAPSIVTVHDRLPSIPGAVLLMISQSGGSPDLVAVANKAHDKQIPVIAILNNTESPLASAADFVVPMMAGPERAVAATKSTVAAMVVGLKVVISWANNIAMLKSLEQLPRRLEAAMQLDWSEWASTLVGSRAAFVTGRGYGLGAAREIALKITETLCVPSFGESAAELMHGPRAAIDSNCSVLALRQADNTAISVDLFCKELKKSAVRISTVGGADGTLPWMGDSHHVLDPLCWLPPAYLSLAKTAVENGMDPDNPPFLNKVTQTF